MGKEATVVFRRTAEVLAWKWGIERLWPGDGLGAGLNV